MKMKMNRLLALVMALLMVFQMPVQALADSKTTYQAPSFSLGDLIPQDQVSYQVAVEHYTTAGEAIVADGAPAAVLITGREVSREVDAAMQVNDPAYVYQYAVLQSTDKDNLAFETKGIGIDKHGMLCALNKNTGELNPLTTKGDFVLQLFYEVVEIELPPVGVTANGYTDTESANLTQAFDKMAAASNLGDVEIVLTENTVETKKVLEVPANSGITSLTLTAEEPVAVNYTDGTGAQMFTSLVPVTTDNVSFDLILNDVRPVKRDYNAIIAELKTMNDAELTEALNGYHPTVMFTIIHHLNDDKLMEDWLSKLTAENQAAFYEIADSGKKLSYDRYRGDTSEEEAAASTYALATMSLYEDETEAASVSTFALARSDSSGDSTLTTAAETTEDQLYENKSVVYNGDGTYTITLEVAQNNFTTTTQYTGLDVVLVLDTSSSMINNSVTVGATYTSTEVMLNDYEYRDLYNGSYFVLVDGKYYQVYLESRNSTNYYYENASGTNVTISSTDAASTAVYQLSGGESVTRLALLKSAASSFVNNVANNYSAAPAEDKPRFSVVSFNSSATTNVAFPALFTTADEAAAHYSNVTSKISGLSYATGTNLYAGLLNGKTQIDNIQTDETYEDRKQVVIAFTDGSYYSNQTQTSTTATAIKDEIDGLDDNVALYGINFGGDGADQLEALVSTPTSSYFHSATDETSLLAAFDAIMEDVQSSIPVNVVVKDVVDSRFLLTEASFNALISTTVGAKIYANGTQITAYSDYVKAVESNVETTIEWPSTVLQSQNLETDANGNLVLPEGDTANLVITLTIEAKEDYVGDNVVPTNGEGSGVYDEAGNLVDEFPYPEVNVEIKQYGTNDSVYRLVGTTEGLSAVDIYHLLYDNPAYDPVLGDIYDHGETDSSGNQLYPYVKGVWVGESGEPEAVTIVTTDGASYTVNLTIYPTVDSEGLEGVQNNNDGVPIWNSEDTDSNDLTFTYNPIIPQFDGGEIEIFLGEDLSRFELANLVTVTGYVDADGNVIDPTANGITAEEVAAYEAALVYKVGDTLLADYVPSAADTQITVDAYYGDMKVGTATIAITVHKGAIQVTKTTNDGAAVNVEFTVAHDGAGEVDPTLNASYTVVANNTTGTIVGGTEIVAGCSTTYTLPMGTYKVTETVPDNYTGVKTTDTVTIGRNADDTFTHTGVVALENARKLASLTITKTLIDETLTDETSTKQPYAFLFTVNDETVEAIWDEASAQYVATVANLKVGDTYTVTETSYKMTADADAIAIDGIYTVAANDQQVTIAEGSNAVAFQNTRVEYGDVTVTKTWNDGSITLDAEGARPELTITLNGSNGLTKSEKMAAGTTSVTFTNLPKVDLATGEEITYTVTESGYGAGYTSDGDTKEVVNNAATFTNSRNTTSLTGTKTWVDSDNQYGTRPETITVKLLRNGTEIASQPVDATAGYSWDNLPTYAKDGVTAYTYTVAEAEVNGYTSTPDGENLTNTLNMTTVVVTKTWNDNGATVNHTADDITVALGTVSGDTFTAKTTYDAPVTDGEGTTFTYTFTVPAMEAASLYAQETLAEAYAADYNTTTNPVAVNAVGDDTYAASFQNSRKTAGVSIVKEIDWNGTTVEPAQFTLVATITEPGKAAVTKNIVAAFNGTATTYTVEGETAQTGEYKLENLPVGTTVAVAETATGWTVALPETHTVVEDDTSVLTVKNTRATSTVIVTKVWEDNSDASGLRPENITVKLLGDTVKGAQTVPSWTQNGNTWTYTFQDQPTHTVDGTPIPYTITEDQVEWYEDPAAYDQANLTVTNTIDSGDLTVTKTADYVPTAGRTVYVQVSGVFADTSDTSKVVSFDLANPAEVTITGLIEGQTYTVAEFNDQACTSPVTDYTLNTTFFTYGAEGVTALPLVNTVDKVTVTVQKLSADTPAVAADTFTFQATKDGVAFGDAFTLGFGETKTFENVEVGAIIEVEETAKASYYKEPVYSATNNTAVTEDGLAITVTNERQTATLTLSKTSDFAQEGDTITLTVNGPVVNGNVIETADQDVTFTFDGSAWTTTDEDPVLLVGQTYTIAEGGTNANLFTYEVVGGANVTPADTTAVSKVVENTRKTTSLTLEKNVTNPVNDTAFTFELTCLNLADKTYGDVVFNQQGVATVTVENNGSKTIEDLPVDVVIDIVEIGADNYVTTNTHGDGVNASITLVEAADSNEVTYDNSRTVTKFTLQKVCADPVPGDEFTITVTGAFAGNDSDSAVRTYTFTVGEDGAITPASVEVPSLKGATYTVVETAVESSAANYTTTGEIKTAAQIADDATVTITNTRDSGSVVYAKIAENVTTDGGKTFNFTVNGAETGTYTGTTAITPAGTDADKVIITDAFKAGETVTVTEDAYANYTTYYQIVNAKTLINEGIEAAIDDSKWTEGSAASLKAYSGKEADASCLAVVFKNVRKTGTATFYKDITTPNEVLDDETFTITVTGNMLVNGVLTENESFSLEFTKADYMADGKLAGKAVLPGYELLEGETYDVTETVRGAELSTYTVGGANTDAKEYTYTAANATHTVTNAKKSGGIIVAKALSDDAMSQIARTETFTLRVEGPFSDGKTYMDVVLPENGSWEKNLGNADGIILGETYTVTEQNTETDNYDAPAYSAESIEAKETPDTLTVTNTRTVGSLTLTKKAIDATENGGLTFTFTLSTTDTRLANQSFTTNRDGVTVTFGGEANGKVTSNEITFTVEAGAESTDSITVNGLPKGVTFTVTETEDADYTAANNNAAVTITGKGDAVTVTNTRKTGDLTVEKTVDHQVAESRTYYFKVTGNFADETTEQVLSVTRPSQPADTIEGLLLENENYTIVEYSDEACTKKVTDYTFTVNGNAATQGEYSFTYTGTDGAMLLAVANTVKGASIVVEKIAENATEDHKTFTFSVVGQSSGTTYENETLTVDETGRASITLDGFWDGESVVVTERTDTENYTASVGAKNSANGNDPAFTAGTSVTVTALSDATLGGNNQAVIKNERNTADGKITKVLNSASLTLDTESFVITVTGDMLVDDVLTGDYVATATIQANTAEADASDVKTWNDVAFVGPNQELIKLLDGETYTLNEVIYNGETLITDRYTITGTGEFTYYVDSTYTVTNEKNPGALTVVKATEGYVDVESFDVKVSGNFAVGTEVDANGYVTVTIPVDGTPVSVPGVILGETYTVVEELDDDNYTVDLGDPTVATAEGAAITVTNTREVTTLTIDKVVVGTEADKAAEYAFTVTGPNGLNETFTLADATAAKVIENVPVGMTVTITETLNDKYTTTATANGAAVTLVGGEMTYTIDEDADNVVVYTNTRNVFANSQIVKTMTAEDYAAMNDTDELTITVEGQMFANGEYANATVSTPAFGKANFVKQADGSYAYTWTIEGKQLLEGESYTATETGNDNFVFTTVSVATGTDLTTAVITTANALKGGAIKVQKNAIVGYAGDDSVFTVEITGTMKNAAGETVENVTITAEVTAGGEAVSVTGGTANDVAYTLIAGQTYTVTETGIDNYNVEYAIQANTAVADENAATVTTITNTRKGAQLTLTKTVEDVSTLVEGDTFTFTVERDTELSSTEAVQVTGEDVVSSTVNGKTITVVLKANTSATITGLFLNEPVTVTETLNTNYDLTDIASNLTGAAETATAVSGNLPADGTATFTNARKDADVLKVKKEMSSELALSQLPTGKIFTVEVTGSAYDTDVAGWTKADNGYTYTLTFNADEIEVGTEKEVPGALYGIAYTATEIGEGTSYTPSYSTNNGAVLSKTETGTVITVTNTPVTGELKIKKLIPSYYNDLTDQQNLSGDELIGTGLATVTVTAEGFNETYTFTKANVDAGYEWSVPGVVEGQTYTVTETWQHSELEYTTQSHTTIVAGKSGSNTLATVTNDRRAYELTLNKSTDYVGDVAGNFTFAITGVFADSKGESVTREVTVTMNGAAGTAKVDNLLAGYTYSIEEKDSANYTFTVDGSETVSQNPFTYTNTDADKNGEVTLTVANTRVKADLKVTKNVDAALLASDDVFTLTVTGEFVNDAAEVKHDALTFTFTAAELANGTLTKTIMDADELKDSNETIYAMKGAAYTVDEAECDFDPTYTVESVTLKADGTDELIVTNARKANAGLTVEKIANGYIGETEEFTVRITGTGFDKTEAAVAAAKDAGWTFGANNDGTFYVEHVMTAGQKLDVPCVLYGVEYTVREPALNTDLYEAAVASAPVTVGAEAAELTITNNRISDAGFTVNKTMLDNKPLREGDKLTITVTGNFNKVLGDGQFEAYTGTLTLAEYTTTPTGAVVNLPEDYETIKGETYTVTETITGEGDLSKIYTTTFNGAAAVVTGDTSAIRTYDYTYTAAAAEGEVNVAIVNERLTAPLTLKKTLVDTTESAVDARTFTFVIAADQDLTEGDVTWDETALAEDESVVPDYEADTVTVTINAVNDKTTKLIVNLPVSVIYTITEIDGAGYDTTNTMNNGTAGTNGSIELMDAAEVGFTNTRGSGALVVTKNIVGYDLTQNFTFTLTETETRKQIGDTFTLTDNGTVTITGLATDTQYTITETGDENYTTTVSVNRAEAVEALYADVAITAESHTTVAFTNTRDTGALTVTKAMVGPVKEGDVFQLVVNGYKTFTDNGFTFLVPTEEESEYATYTLTPGKATVIDGLMAGVNYTLTEKLTNGEIGTNYTARWDDGTEGFVLSNVAGGADQAITLTNTRDAKEILVTKAVNGIALAGEEFVIQVTGAEGFRDADGNQIVDETGAVITTATATFAYDAETWTDDQLTLNVTVDGTVDGTETVAYAYEGGSYTFAELTANGKEITAADCAWTVSYTDNGAMVEGDAAFTGTVTNSQNAAQLTVTKIFSGIMAENEVFEITVTGVFVDGTETRTHNFFDSDLITSGTVTGTDRAEDGSFEAWVLNDVIYGNTYTVTEKILVNGVENTVRYQAPAIAASPVLVKEASAVTVTNARDLTAALTVAKEATNVTTDGGDTFTFTVTSEEILLTGTVDALLTKADGTTETRTLLWQNGSVTFTLKEDETMTLNGLPEDITFIVTEDENTNYTTTNTHGEALEGEITLADANTVTFTNARNTGELTVKKTADQLVNGETTFYFTVEGNFAGENGAAVKDTREVTVIVSGTAPFEGVSEPIQGALDGETYTITEYADRSYETVMANYTVAVNGKDNGSVNVTYDASEGQQTVVNTTDTGKLTVEKSFVGPVKEGDTFRITINAENVEGKLVITTDETKMVFKDITTAQPTVTFEGLIAGQEYTLTETLANEAGEVLTKNYTGSWENNQITVTGAEQDQTIQLTNTRNSGDGTVVKTMLNATDVELAEAARDTFRITVTGLFMYQQDNTWHYLTKDVTVDIAGNALDVPVQLTEGDITYCLVYGETYTVTETAIHEGKTSTAYTAAYLPDASFEYDGTAAWISDTAEASIHVDNTLAMKEVTVVKTVVDESHEENGPDYAFDFTYSRSDGLEGKNFQLKDGESKTFTYPADVTVTIVETENTGYTTTVQLDNASDDIEAAEAIEALKIENVDEGIVTFTNTRILKTMDAAKVVAGPDPITLVNESDVEIAFTFRVLKDGEPVSNVDLSIAEGDMIRTETTEADGAFTIYNGEIATALNLADNYTYTFDEIDQPEFYLEPVINVDEETGLTTIINPREEKTLEVTKTLEEMTRALEGDTFTLKVTGRFTNDPDNDQTLTFVFDMNDGTLAQLGGEATKTLMEAEELKDLETEVFAYAGLTYILEEEAPENFDAPVITEITEGEEAYTGSVENIRSRSDIEENVTLTKVVENVSLMDDADQFAITLMGLGLGETGMTQIVTKDDLIIDAETDTASFTWILTEGQILLDGETYTLSEIVTRDGVILPEIAYEKTFEGTGEMGEANDFVYDKPETSGENVVTVTNVPEEPEPGIDKTVDQASVHSGDTVTYTLTYTNTAYTAAVVTDNVDNFDSERMTFVPGSVKIDGAAAADPVVEAGTLTFEDLIVPAATEGEDGTLTAGKLVVTYQMSVALLETDEGHAEILNTIEGNCRNKDLNDDISIICDDPVITVEKKVSHEAVYAGEGYTYTLVVTNSGLAQGVVEITDTLDDELIRFVEFSGTNPVTGVYEENSGVETVSWKFNIPAATQDEETGDITPAVYELSFRVNTVYAQDGTVVYNKATVESNDPFDEDETNEVQTIILNPPAYIVKSADKEEINPGEQLEYTLKVISNSLAAHPVVVEDVLPDGVTFKSFVTLGLNGVQDAENPQKLTWSFDMPAATRVSETTITPAVMEIKFTVTADALTESNVKVVTNVGELDETPADPTDDRVPSNPVDTVIKSEVWVEKYASTNFAYVGTTYMYVFRFHNTNTAPVTGRFVDYFDQYLAVVDFEKAPGTAGYEHVAGQQIYEDNSIGIDFVLPAATANADGTVTPSWVDVGVYVQALDFPADTSNNVTNTITIPNTGAYRDDLSNEVKNTNTVYVLVEKTSFLPVTGEATMYLVPVGALLVLLGVALMINERRRRLQESGR